MLILLGAPGAGVGSVSRALASEGFRVADASTLAAELGGMPLGQAYVDLGDEHARRIEAEAALTTLDSEADVAVLTSGAIRDDRVRAAVAGHDVVWLGVSVSQLARRLRLGSIAPSVIGSPRAMLIGMLAERDPLYASVATVTIDTDALSPADVVSRVLEVVGPPRAP